MYVVHIWRTTLAGDQASSLIGEFANECMSRGGSSAKALGEAQAGQWTAVSMKADCKRVSGCQFVARSRYQVARGNVRGGRPLLTPRWRSGPHCVRPKLLCKFIEPGLLLSSWVRIPLGAPRADSSVLRRELALKFGGR